MNYLCKTMMMLTLCLSGCLPFYEGDIQATRISFTKPTPQPILNTSTINSQRLRVSDATCLPSLNTTRVMIVTSDKGIQTSDYISQVLWRDPLPQLIVEHLIENLSQRALFAVVGGSAEKFEATHVLQTHINRFEIRAPDAGSQAYICLEISHIFTPQNKNNNAVQKKIHLQVPMATFNTKNCFLSFDQAFQNYQEQLSAWIHTHLK